MFKYISGYTYILYILGWFKEILVAQIVPCLSLKGPWKQRERSHMTSAAERGGGFKMLTVADKEGRGSKPC